jgi:hypothetical protein
VFPLPPVSVRVFYAILTIEVSVRNQTIAEDCAGWPPPFGANLLC